MHVSVFQHMNDLFWINTNFNGVEVIINNNFKAFKESKKLHLAIGGFGEALIVAQYPIPFFISDCSPNAFDPRIPQAGSIRT